MANIEQQVPKDSRAEPSAEGGWLQRLNRDCYGRLSSKVTKTNVEKAVFNSTTFSIFLHQQSGNFPAI